MLIIRGHHLLCIQGFQGMGYSPEFVENMSEIVNKFRDDTCDFPIRVIVGFDIACQACPHRGARICQAGAGSNQHVVTMDKRVVEHLGIIPWRNYQKSYLLAEIAKKVSPSDLDVLCKGCSWLQYGVCKQGIADLRAKHGIGTNHRDEQTGQKFGPKPLEKDNIGAASSVGN